MGGYNAGEVASGMATTLLSTELEAALNATAPHKTDAGTGKPYAHRCIVEKVAATNSAIFNAAESQPQYAGMRTTLVMALFYDNHVTVAHIGDSRLYRLRGTEFGSITRDHSLLQEQIDSGMISLEEARHSQNKNLVTRALGVDPEVETELHDYEVLPGDIYLLCSDGLNDMVEDEEIQLTLQMLGANLELAATQLIQMANDNGGRDNVSVIVIKVLREFPAAKGWWSKLMAWFR
jgi:protein phosphatase